jgi:hypothetical protein
VRKLYRKQTKISFVLFECEGKKYMTFSCMKLWWQITQAKIGLLAKPTKALIQTINFIAYRLCHFIQGL